jgi:hypothetical protein
MELAGYLGAVLLAARVAKAWIAAGGDYTSLAQCAMSASGCAAECMVNPYFASAQERGDRVIDGIATPTRYLLIV